MGNSRATFAQLMPQLQSGPITITYVDAAVSGGSILTPNKIGERLIGHLPSLSDQVCN